MNFKNLLGDFIGAACIFGTLYAALHLPLIFG